MMRTILCASLLFLLPVAATAQSNPDPVWSGLAEFSWVSTSGNSSTQTTGGAGELHYKPGIWSGEMKLSFVRSENDGVENARTLKALLGAARELRENLDIYGRVSGLQNRFAGIDHQVLAQVGTGWELLHGEPHRLRLEAGVGHTSEKRTNGTDLSFANVLGNVEYRWKFSANAELSEEASFVADVENSENWRFTNGIAVSAGLTSLISMKLSHSLLYQNDPVPGLETTDTTISAAVVAKF